MNVTGISLSMQIEHASSLEEHGDFYDLQPCIYVQHSAHTVYFNVMEL
jgi:hypothetical protein